MWESSCVCPEHNEKFSDHYFWLLGGLPFWLKDNLDRIVLYVNFKISQSSKFILWLIRFVNVLRMFPREFLKKSSKNLILCCNFKHLLWEVSSTKLTGVFILRSHVLEHTYIQIFLLYNWYNSCRMQESSILPWANRSETPWRNSWSICFTGCASWTAFHKQNMGQCAFNLVVLFHGQSICCEGIHSCCVF